MPPEDPRQETGSASGDLPRELARAHADRESAEAAQRRAEERLRLCLEQSWDAVLMIDDAGVVRYANPAVRAIVISGDTLVGRELFGVVAEKDRGAVADALARARRGPATVGPFELQVHGADGMSRLLEARVRGVASEAEGSIVVLTARDSGEHAAVEERLAETKRIDTIGRLAKTVAHDGHNVMRVIMAYSDLLLETLAPDDPRRGQLESIRRASEWGAVLTGDLLRAARDPDIPSTSTDLNVVISSVAPMLLQLMGADVELVTTLDPFLGRVGIAAGELEQLVMNLVLHARAGLARGGVVTVETANAPGAPPRRAGDPGLGPSIMLAVSRGGTADRTGAPLVEAWVDEARGETAMGLSAAYQIVKDNGGHIAVSSDGGGGSTFRIYLPRLEETPTVTPEPTADAPLAGGSETVLVVEDEKPVRELIRDILRLHGYTVLVAREGKEALAVAARHSGAIDLIVTDVIMPGLSSRDVVERLAASRPGMKALYISGYTDELIGQHEFLSVGTDFLQKPFTVDALARKVREVLDSH